jgi:aminoglycoside phosphotransferase (APT) family kinase protein
LARFHIATRNDEVDVAGQVVDLCDQYLARFGGPGSGMIETVRAAAPRLPPLRAVIRHPDFNIWNLLRDGNQIHVIDWEGAAPGPPLCDLVQFTVHWHEYVTRRRPQMPDEEGLRAVLAERSRASWADAAVAEVLSRYMSRLGIADDWFDVLAVTTWVESALKRELQLVDAGCSRDERDRHNFGVRYVQALSRVSHRAPSEVASKVGVA